MEVKLYRNTSETIVVDKNLTEMASLRATLNESCNVLQPRLIITMTEDMFTTNYCYIPKFKRYYYINNITIVDLNRCEISCSVDVLMTYKEHIKKTTQNVVRQENLFNMYMEDGNVQILGKTGIQALNFKNGFVFTQGALPDLNCYVLNTL